MNAYGIETCYQEIGKKLHTQFPELMPISRNEFYRIFWDKIVISKFIKENVPVFQLLHTDRFQPTEIPGLVNFEANYWHKPRLISNNKPLSPLTVWLVSDSYFLLSGHQEREYPVFRGDIPLLAYHTKNLFTTHVQYFLSPFFQELLKKGSYPDILIETLVERNWTTMDRAKEDPFIRIAGDIYLHTPGYLFTPKLKEQYIYMLTI